MSAAASPDRTSGPSDTAASHAVVPLPVAAAAAFCLRRGAPWSLLWWIGCAIALVAVAFAAVAVGEVRERRGGAGLLALPAVAVGLVLLALTASLT